MKRALWLKSEPRMPSPSLRGAAGVSLERNRDQRGHLNKQRRMKRAHQFRVDEPGRASPPPRMPGSRRRCVGLRRGFQRARGASLNNELPAAQLLRHNGRFHPNREKTCEDVCMFVCRLHSFVSQRAPGAFFLTSLCF